MESVQNLINRLLALLTEFGNIVTAALTAVELWLRRWLTQLGVPHTVQIVVLVAAAVILVIGSLRLFGGLIRIAVILILALLVMHAVLPVLQH